MCDVLVLNQGTLITVLTRSVRFRARVTVLLLFEAPFCQARPDSRVELLSRVVYAIAGNDAGNDLLAARRDSQLGGDYGIRSTSLCRWIEPARAEHG